VVDASIRAWIGPQSPAAKSPLPDQSTTNLLIVVSGGASNLQPA
jgi:hypothetical protein